MSRRNSSIGVKRRLSGSSTLIPHFTFLAVLLLFVQIIFSTMAVGTVEEQSGKLLIQDAPTTSEDVLKFDLSSGSASIDLGPVVVNEDGALYTLLEDLSQCPRSDFCLAFSGTLSRISNWRSMIESERRNTLRVIAKRNKSRLEALKAKGLLEEDVSVGKFSTTESQGRDNAHHEL